MNKARLIATVLSGGGAFSPLSLSPLLWLKADAGTYQDNAFATPATADDAVVGGWQDQSGNGVHFTQANALRKPLLKLNQQNGRPAIRTDGAATNGDHLLTSLLSASSGSFTFYAVIKPPTAGDKLLFDTQTGRLLVSTNGPNAKIGWYDGGWKEVNSSVVGEWQAVTWVLTSGGNGEIFKNGSSQGTLAYTAKALGGTSALFTNYTNTSSWMACDLGEFLIYSGAHTSAQRAQVHGYLSGRWAISF